MKVWTTPSGTARASSTPSSRKTPARWLTRVLTLLAIGLSVAASMKFWPMQPPYPLSAIESEAVWMLMPVWIALGIALASRHRKLTIALGLVAAVHVYWSCEWVFNMGGTANADAPRLRVCSANLLAPQPSPTFARELHAMHVDVLIAEELSNEWMALLEREGLHSQYPHRFLEPHVVTEDYFGLGIYSRYPILSQERIEFGAQRFPLMRVDLNVQGRTVRVYAVHTMPPMDGELLAFQERQNNVLLSHLLNDASDPAIDVVLAGGDFNASPTSHQYQRFLDAGLIAAHEATGQGFSMTWPNGTRAIPPMRLDHFFLSRGTPISVRKGIGQGSDHAPIVLDLALPTRRAR